MNKKLIFESAAKKLQELRGKNGTFINIIFDDWRGYRFIYDTEEVRNCRNDCENCSLFKLLKDEKPGVFSAALIPATKEDKKLFGNQNFLNCKTKEQYKNCYVSFLLEKANTKKEIEDELALVKELRIVFSRSGDKSKVEKGFKASIINEFMKRAPQEKQDMVNEMFIRNRRCLNQKRS